MLAPTMTTNLTDPNLAQAASQSGAVAEALVIDLIRENIFETLKAADLKIFRLVCRSWRLWGEMELQNRITINFERRVFTGGNNFKSYKYVNTRFNFPTTEDEFICGEFIEDDLESITMLVSNNYCDFIQPDIHFCDSEGNSSMEIANHAPLSKTYKKHFPCTRFKFHGWNFKDPSLQNFLSIYGMQLEHLAFFMGDLDVNLIDGSHNNNCESEMCMSSLIHYLYILLTVHVPNIVKLVIQFGQWIEQIDFDTNVHENCSLCLNISTKDSNENLPNEHFENYSCEKAKVNLNLKVLIIECSGNGTGPRTNLHLLKDYIQTIAPNLSKSIVHSTWISSDL